MRVEIGQVWQHPGTGRFFHVRGLAMVEGSPVTAFCNACDREGNPVRRDFPLGAVDRRKLVVMARDRAFPISQFVTFVLISGKGKANGQRKSRATGRKDH